GESSGKVPRPGRLTRPGSTRSVRFPFTRAFDASRTPRTSRISCGLPVGAYLLAGVCNTMDSNVNDDANSLGHVGAVVHRLIAGTRYTRLYPPAAATCGRTSAVRIATRGSTKRMDVSSPIRS